MKNLAIVEHNKSGGLFMMEKNDFRISENDYTVIEDVLNIGRYENIPNHSYKARLARTANTTYYVFYDWSAVEI